MKWVNDSCKDGRDSWLVNWVFGKKDEVVVTANLCRQDDEVLLGLETVSSVSGAPRKGLGQQP